MACTPSVATSRAAHSRCPTTDGAAAVIVLMEKTILLFAVEAIFALSIILSYRLWQTEFGGDPAVIGERVVAGEHGKAVLRRRCRAKRAIEFLAKPLKAV